jgi:uncharacterized membrane-anchored protein YjiN (DUF445 family)
VVSALLRLAVHDVPAAAIKVPRAIERDVRDRIGRASVALVDSALASPYADVVVGQVLSSGIAERAIERALSSELVDVVSTDLIRYEVVERVTEQMLAAGVADRLAERIVESVLESPGIERVVDRIVESRLLEQTVTRIVDDVVADLATSEAMWGLIDVIARSPAVTDAISQQGVGFADQVAEEVREHSRSIDARLERGAWKILRRRPRAPAAGGEAPPAAGTT